VNQQSQKFLNWLKTHLLKTDTEKFITKFAKYYTPVVVIGALFLAILPPLLFSGQTFNDWIYRALVVLVISCPCALVISIPLGYFGGIGSASRKRNPCERLELSGCFNSGKKL